MQACRDLGSMFMYRVYDYDKAEEWLLKAVEAGDSDSFTRVMLGELYSGATGSDKIDYEKAIEWYTKAVECDDSSAYGAFRLGTIYYEGQGVEADYEKAFEYFNIAVEAWKETDSTDIFYPETVKKIGDMYRSGQGVEMNEEKAAEYYKWADELNSR